MKKLIRIFRRPPDFIIGNKEDPYLLRWWVIPRNRFFNIYLHRILRDDDDRALHDHPWPSCSIILKGGYFECMPFQFKYRQPGSIVFRRATQAHRLELDRVAIYDQNGRFVRREILPAWTLFITGPKVREWGFHCPKGWVHWRDFVSPHNSGEIGPGCGE